MYGIRRWAQLGAMVVATIAAAACGRTDGVGAAGGAALAVSSTALVDGDQVPVEFTCDGDDVAPDLAWADVPAAAVEIVVVVDDPDAPGGTFTHWTVWGLPPNATPIDGDLPDAAVEGTNDFGRVGYRGPCPPVDDGPHQYRFRVFALDSALDLPRGAAPAQLSAAINGHVLAQGELRASYAR
jgi:Raf kinase inhibitor-like YbhB/YbcL family protein